MSLRRSPLPARALAARSESNAALRALGEHPAEFEQLRRDLLRAYPPGDPLWARQVEDLARLYWRRARLERAKNGLLVVQREKLDQERERREMEEDREAHETLDVGVEAGGLWRLPDSLAKFRAMGSTLETLEALVETRRFDEVGKALLDRLYGHYKPWRGATLTRLYEAMARAGKGSDEDAGMRLENLRTNLRGELEAVRKQYHWWKARNAPPSPAACDASLAPEGKAWTLILRAERDLDRAIDRKVKILLSLRRSAASHAKGGNNTHADTSPSRGVEDNTATEAAACVEE